MGKLKRDYGDVDRTKEGGYSGDLPLPGLYDFKLHSVDDHNDETVVWVFECTEEPYVGFRGWVYTNGTSAAWKETQILEAAGLITKDEDKFDMDYKAIVKKASTVRCKLKHETYEGEKRAKITTILPMPEGSNSAKTEKKGKKKKSDTPFG